MVIDSHVHLYAGEDDYVDRLVAEARRLGIDKLCVSGLGRMFNMLENEAVLAAMRRYPEVIVGYVFIRLGVDGPEKVEWAREQGFRGVKFTCPLADYDHPAYFPVYEKAAQLGMPALFHTGIVTAPGARPDDGISSARMRPILLDGVAKAFPQWPIVMAHLGMPWYAEAAEMARLNANVYVDISGSPQGFRRAKTPAFFAEHLWWDGALRKVVFGSDVHWRDMEAAMAYDRRVWEVAGATPDDLAAIFGGTVASWLGWA